MAAAGADGMLIDTRSLAKPPRFNGEEARWQDFRFTFEAYCGLVGVDMLDMMNNVAVSTRPVRSMTGLAPGQQRVSKTLFYLLVQLTSGRALGMLKTIGDANGLEGWRRMSQHYEPRAPVRSVGLLQAILTPTFRIRPEVS